MDPESWMRTDTDTIHALKPNCLRRSRAAPVAVFRSRLSPRLLARRSEFPLSAANRRCLLPDFFVPRQYAGRSGRGFFAIDAVAGSAGLVSNFQIPSNGSGCLGGSQSGGCKRSHARACVEVFARQSLACQLPSRIFKLRDLGSNHSVPLRLHLPLLAICFHGALESVQPPPCDGRQRLMEGAKHARFSNIGSRL